MPVKHIVQTATATQQDPLWQQLLNHATQLATLAPLVQAALPAELRPHCQLANWRQNCLILTVDNPVWANRLHYQIPTLLKQLKTEPALYNLSRLEYYVKPAEFTTKNIRSNPAHQQHRLSSHSAELLRDSAEAINDPGLRQALLKLAQRSRQIN